MVAVGVADGRVVGVADGRVMGVAGGEQEYGPPLLGESVWAGLAVVQQCQEHPQTLERHRSDLEYCPVSLVTAPTVHCCHLPHCLWTTMQWVGREGGGVITGSLVELFTLTFPPPC